MKRLVPFALLLLFSGCGQSSEDTDDSSLLDLYDDSTIEGLEDGDQDVEEEELPNSEGPTEIPDDLFIPE